jgi:hypothetical protein
MARRDHGIRGDFLAVTTSTRCRTTGDRRERREDPTMDRLRTDELQAKTQTTATRRDVVKRFGALGLGGLAFAVAGVATVGADDDGGGGRRGRRRRNRRRGRGDND